MRKKTFITLLCFLFVSLSIVAVERNYLTGRYDESAIHQHLLCNQEWVSLPAYANRAAWDDLLGVNRAPLIKNGERQLDYHWEYIPASAYLEFMRSGNRKIMEDPDSRNKNALADLFLAELAEGQGRFMDKIIDGVYYQLERSSWVLSAHLPRQLDSNNQEATGSSLPNGETQIIDLVDGEIGGMISWIYYFFHTEFDKVDPAISRYIERELEARIFTPFEQYDHWWMGLQNQFTNNWNPWCNFNTLQCYMLVLHDRDRLTRAVMRSMLSVDKFMNYVKADGACEEGPSYWGHAAGKMFDYLDLLNLVTGGYVDIFAEPQIKAMGEYIARTQIGGDHWVVNFADATAKFSDNATGVVYRYGKRVNSPLMISYAQQSLNVHPNIWLRGTDVYRSLTGLQLYQELVNLPPLAPAHNNIWYCETEFMYTRQGNWFMGAKCGNNGESHNHNDVGSCLLYYNNEPVLIDAGTGTYTRQTFSEERYTLWMMQSGWHNLPVINGVEQRNGKAYRGEVIQAKANKSLLQADISGAYPKEAGVNAWVRTYRLSKSGLVITDQWKLKAEPVTANKVHFLFHKKEDIARLKYNQKQFKIEVEEKPLPDPRLSKIWGNTIYRVILTDLHPQQGGSYRFEIE